MADSFFTKPIINSPYESPTRHWELDGEGQPTHRLIDRRRRAEFVTPIPKARKRKTPGAQDALEFGDRTGVSTQAQEYDPTPIINELRGHVDRWRALPKPGDWQVTPETARLLRHWRHHRFDGIRPFFCQIEAVETLIWLTEVAARRGRRGKTFLDHLEAANAGANPGLARLALKLATGAGKTTVMAMIIAWQTVNAVRRPGSRRFSRGFLVVTPGLTIRDRLRVLHPNDPDSYYRGRELVPADMLADLGRARIVITNFHAFRRRETLPLSRGGRALLQGRGASIRSIESDGQMLQRVMPELMGMKDVLVLNDEAHHCYREKPGDEDADTGGGGGGGAGSGARSGVQGGEVPPCFIVVCNNTSTSKLVYDYVSGFHRGDGDGDRNGHGGGAPALVQGRLPLFRNFDEGGAPLPRPNTLLIDSEQLESGELLDPGFRKMASDEIERFRREIVERTGDRREAGHLTDQDLLREVMNTVGKADRLGGSIRCVVSVSMLSEGWDASTVTHVLGVRAFGTQLLCEQVVGRALRRQSYDLDEDGRFNVEYADVLGIPFDFTAKPVVEPPQPPRKTVHVKAVTPERDACEIRFPRVEGYRVELPEERLSARFDDDSTLELTPDLVGPSKTLNQGIIGEGVDLNLVHTRALRRSTLLYHLAKRLLETRWRDPGEAPKLHLFGQLKRITRQWLDGHLVCKGGTYPAQLMYQELADVACERITRGIVAKLEGERPVKAVLDPYNPAGSTAHVNFRTSKALRWETAAGRSHVNWAICDSEWEAEFCRVAESHPRVRAYVKNDNLGFEAPYRFGSEARRYRPDFIVLVDDGRGGEDPLHLVVEVKGYRREDAKEKKAAMETFWVPGVNRLGTFGRWAFAEFGDVYEMQEDFGARVEAAFDGLIEGVLA